MAIEFRSRELIKFLFVTIGCFILAHIVGQFIDIFRGNDFWLSLFGLDQQRSIPRFYSAVMLLLCSGFLLMIAKAKKGDNRYSYLCWLGLAFIFLFFAIIKDTAAHESLSIMIRSALNVSKIQFYTWIYGIVVVLFPLVYLKFLLNLPRKTKILFTISGSTFIISAFGLDLIGAYLGKSFGSPNLVSISLDILEEGLEMCSTVVFLYALLLYLSTEMKWNGVRITE